MNNTSLRKNYFSNESTFDYGIVLIVMILAIISLASIYATTVLIEGKSILPTLFHALWYFIGVLVVMIAINFDSKKYWDMSIYLYGIGMILLVLVLLFHDRELAARAGAKSWFRFGPFSFQPSELFKPAYIIILARCIVEHNTHYTNRQLKSDFILLGKIAVLALPAIILIQRQNDLGTNLVVLAITAGMILVSGISWKILAATTSFVSLVGGGLLYVAGFHPQLLLSTSLVKEYQINRISAWLNPFGDTQSSAYQLAQSIKAIGSGQFIGKGFGVSQVSVPVRESDFIFTTIAENFGFVGSAVLLLLYLMLIYRMVQTCFEIKNEFYSYIAAGVISMIMFHVLENIGMTIGLLPITGIPLPFISQGGSALLGNMIGIALILSMKHKHRKYHFANSEEYLN